MKKMTIGDLARRLGLRTSAIRYYEEQGLLEPVGRTESGYRIFDEASEKTLLFIQRAQRLGFSLSDIKILLDAWHQDNLSGSSIIAVAEERYLALEQRATESLVMLRELQLFLQEYRQNLSSSKESQTGELLSSLLDRVCADPLTKLPNQMFEWLIERSGCELSSEEAKQLLEKLRSQHIHIWQIEDGYSILVVSKDPEVERILTSLTRLMNNCHVHSHPNSTSEVLHNDEGFQLIVHGENAFIFARLFLALE